jgi:DNA-binding PadR family transcriptional regulator
MSIEFAILGFLTGGPLSGYDLKKRFSETEGLHWSGNNNQVYKALLGLSRQGQATVEIQQPAEGPARKLYSITAEGRQALRDWLLTEPELPQFRLPILVHLMSSDLLSAEELDGLIGRYAEEVRLKILGMEELQRRGKGPSFGTERQVALWQVINRRPIGLLCAEEEWLHELRWVLSKQAKGES